MGQFHGSDKELILGGMPLSLSEYNEQITETIYTSPHINNKITVYAINIIKKYKHKRVYQLKIT